MATELDRLANMLASEMTEDDIDRLITLYRKQIAMYNSGIKPKREAEEQIDMAAIVESIAVKRPVAPAKKMVRRM